MNNYCIGLFVGKIWKHLDLDFSPWAILGHPGSFQMTACPVVLTIARSQLPSSGGKTLVICCFYNYYI